MAKQPDFPRVEVAATLIIRETLILAVYNPQWGSFTLPMTKRRVFQDPKIPTARQEEWIDAAARAAAQHLERTLTDLIELAVKVPPYQQSDRTGEWKNYQFRVFRCWVGEAEEGIGGDAAAQWLTVDQFLDENRRPISPTARHILGAVLGSGVI